MQRKRKLGFWMVGLLLSAPFAVHANPPVPSVTSAPKEEIKEAEDGLDVFFREEDLLAMSAQKQEVYAGQAPGESALIARAFPGAPPSIPHTTEEMLPITATDNECLTCHHPDAAGAGDIPFPPSHFLSPVMGKGKKRDAMVWVVKDYAKLKDLMGARYNCVMCHTEQAQNVETPKSTFVVEKIEKKQ